MAVITRKIRSAGQASESQKNLVARASRTGLDKLRVRFCDRDLENCYREHLRVARLKRELIAQLLAVVLFLCYGALDFFAVGDLARTFLGIRLFVVAPIILALIALTATPRWAEYQEWTSTIGLCVCSFAIILMIYLMPASGAPPYIVGLLFSMILASCLLRVSFIIAAPSYCLIAAAYCISLLAREGVPEPLIASGLFFMLSVTGVACITNYVQETRSREVWLRNVQKEIDTERIEALLIEATAADRSKINFLSVLTHELRTPLHQIIGFSEVVRNSVILNGRPELTAQSDLVIDAARGLLGKISQLLRYADAVAGKLSFSQESVSAPEIVESVVDQAAAICAARGVSLNTSGVERASLYVDQHHTLYALYSVVENAVKASAPGAVVKIDGSLTTKGLYEFRVIDHGEGMSAEALQAAMKPFEQMQPARTRGRDGLGLGLAIADRLLRGQGGELRLESIRGVGTTVVIVLPTPDYASLSASYDSTEPGDRGAHFIPMAAKG